jgi:phosphatidylinositol alpha-1,6-mannosyltransferase
VTPPRTLIITPDFPPAFGGIQTLMGQLARNLSGIPLRVITFDSPGASEFDRSSGVNVRRSSTARAIPKARIGMLGATALRESLRFRPQALLVGHVAAAPASAFVRRAMRIPSIQYVHAEEFRVWPRVTSFAVRDAAAVIAVSRHAREMALASGADGDSVHLIHNGVDIPTDDGGAMAERPVGPPTVVTVARLADPHKGHDVMLRALPLLLDRIPEARWIVIGDGPLRGELERRAAEAGLGAAVEFLGATTDRERDRWLSQANVFAMPSRCPDGQLGGEGFGIAYLEAASHRLPVIAGDRGGAVDAIDAGRTGLLVDATDHAAVAEALVALLGDPVRARAMGDAGYERAQRFSWPAAAARVADVIEAVAAHS